MFSGFKVLKVEVCRQASNTGEPENMLMLTE